MNIQDMTQNGKNDLLATLWNDPAVTLQGVKDDITSAIDRVRRVMSNRYGIDLSRMKLERSTNAIDCFCSNRVED